MTRPRQPAAPYELHGQDLHTPLGIVPGGLPRDVVQADIALIDDDAANGRVTVHAARVRADPESPAVVRKDRELEVVASFWMRTEMFVSTFKRVATQIEIASHGLGAPCPCGSDRTFADCHGRG